MKSKVLLVDDHKLFISGLEYLLKTYGIDVVGTANDGDEAIKLVKIRNPDIVLLDIRMPEKSGLDVLKFLHSQFPKIKVIMLTTSEEEGDIYEAIKNGASGYLLKSTDAETLVDKLKEVEDGGVLISPQIAIMEERREYNKSDDISENKSKSINEVKVFTSRQVEILEKISQGQSYKKIGILLGITERTVKYHVSKMIGELQSSNRTELVSYAIKNGYLRDK